MQTVWTIIRSRVLRDLNWVCTVCICPFYAGLELVDEVNSGLDHMSLHVLPGPGSLVMRTLPGLTYLLCTQRLVR